MLPEEILRNLLVRLFSGSELREFIRFDPDDPHGSGLWVRLPERDVSRAELAFAVVDLLQRHGRIDTSLFVRLAQARPWRGAEIRGVAALFPGVEAEAVEPRPRTGIPPRIGPADDASVPARVTTPAEPTSAVAAGAAHSSGIADDAAGPVDPGSGDGPAADPATPPGTARVPSAIVITKDPMIVDRGTAGSTAPARARRVGAAAVILIVALAATYGWISRDGAVPVAVTPETAPGGDNRAVDEPPPQSAPRVRSEPTPEPEAKPEPEPEPGPESEPEHKETERKQEPSSEPRPRDRGVVRRLIDTKAGAAIDGCADRVGAMLPEEVTVHLSVTARGQVTRAKSGGAELEPSFHRCVEATIRALKFPAAADDGDFTYSWRLFHRRSAAPRP